MKRSTSRSWLLLITVADGTVKLLHNEGNGRLIDVTSKAGAAMHAITGARCSEWVDFDADGHLDLLVGCFLRPNGYFRGQGDGTFSDASASIGFGQRVFNTAGLKLVDLNGDKALDLIMNNEAQESLVLLGRKQIETAQAVK